ncbi:MAG: hypothetical protein ACRECY_00995 [Phyllobacterium sp.]
MASLIVMACIVLSSVTRYPAGSWEYPSAIAAGILVLVIWRAAELFASMPVPSAAPDGRNVDEADDSIKEELPLRLTLIYATIVSALVFSLYFVWFPVAASVAGVATLRLVFNTGWLNTVVTALLVSGISSAVFYFLEVPLPGSGF